MNSMSESTPDFAIDGEYVDIEDMVWFDNKDKYIKHISFRVAVKEMLDDEDAKIIATLFEMMNEKK